VEKRYQIFISSTFEDLKEERQGLLKAILEIDHMPAGMELFPAADAQAWQLIRDVIDASDYYVLIVGGRYGSMNEEGLSYTEREYDYAVASGKPVVPLLHQTPDNLPRGKTETSPGAWEKLKAFRAKVESKHTCVYWNNAEELRAKVIVGLTTTMKRRPAVGWVRADQVPSGATLTELLKLRSRIAELESQAEQVATRPPPGTEGLAQGTERIKLRVQFYARLPGDIERKHESTFEPTWDEIFAGVAPSMINEASEEDLRRAFQSRLADLARREIDGRGTYKQGSINVPSFEPAEIATCIVQLRALGLITENKKQRSVKDTNTYWSLTPYGDTVMVRLLAVRRGHPTPSPGENASASPPESDGEETRLTRHEARKLGG
jgi:hypothetical protein